MLRPPVRHVNKNPMTMIIMLLVFAYCYAAMVVFVYLRKIDFLLIYLASWKDFDVNKYIVQYYILNFKIRDSAISKLKVHKNVI